jgi:hypothetical protein
MDTSYNMHTPAASDSWGVLTPLGSPRKIRTLPKPSQFIIINSDRLDEGGIQPITLSIITKHTLKERYRILSIQHGKDSK